MPIIDDVLARVPSKWTPQSYANTLYYEIKVDEEEKNDVLINFPSDLKAQVTSVYRIQNPFMWGRFILRKEHLQARGNSVQEATYYHPIAAADKPKVMEYNLDYRRYTYKSGCQYDSCAKKPILYTDPKEAKDAFYRTPAVLVIVKTTNTDSHYFSCAGRVTKDWDTDYYPEYFVQF